MQLLVDNRSDSTKMHGATIIFTLRLGCNSVLQDVIADCSDFQAKHIITLRELNVQFLGAFAKLRKVTLSFVMSVCLCVRMEQLGFYWTDFRDI